MAYTAPTTRATGALITAAIWNTDLVDNISFLYSVPMALVYNDAAITTTHNVEKTLTFNSERFDTNGIHSTVTNTSRLTCVTAGKYYIFGNVRFATNTTGYRYLAIYINGTNDVSTQLVPVTSDGLFICTIGGIYQLAVNDYAELIAYQNSGGDLEVSAAANYSPVFGMFWTGG